MESEDNDMRRMLAASMVIVWALAAVVGAAENWNGWLDTSAITTFNSTETAYTKAFDLGSYENTSIIVYVNDTTSTGFASDSINFAVGYSTGVPTLNSSGMADTAWSPLIYLDTLVSDSLGKVPGGYTDSDLNGYRNSGWIDTLNVTGWAYQCIPVVPIWDPLIRYGVTGLTGNKVGEELSLLIQHNRRIGEASKDR